ncbi:serine/threonine-protein kinase [Spirulina sp. CCNP1310]|uniref:serine/threonine protein kinase n=1 Tax=Spirulina sp. CCNP1310 TaxID=3110249 RepID=UPI002B1F0623|nr:serine/threonine-protein kinase [Spirulina sp. CCNP1310]MEA5418486.1 serine/threonine-protein kinase [Spirulina sp. CCNP1310]
MVEPNEMIHANRIQPSEQIGSWVGQGENRYQIRDILGQGGMATTYRAWDQQTQQWVAIKVISLKGSRNWKTVEQFEREVNVLKHIDHPAIPNYLDYFERDTPTDRRFYLVQELVEGSSLADLIAQGWRPDELTLQDLARQVLEILDYLHTCHPPIIHRDIKPQNIIRQENGQVYLVDFGAVPDLYRRTQRYINTFVGTLGYMPPEQLAGHSYFASDLYALGTTLLYVLTHRSPAELPQTHLKFNFRPHVTLSPAFADWLDKLIEPSLRARFHSASEALQVLAAKTMVLPARVEPCHRPLPKGSRIRVHKTTQVLTMYTSWGIRGTLFFIHFLLWVVAINWGPELLSSPWSLPWAILWILAIIITFPIKAPETITLTASPFRLKVVWPHLRTWVIEGGAIAQIVAMDSELSKHSGYIRCKYRVRPRPPLPPERREYSIDWADALVMDAVENHEFLEFGHHLSRVEVQWLVRELSQTYRRWRGELVSNPTEDDPQLPPVA